MRVRVAFASSFGIGGRISSALRAPALLGLAMVFLIVPHKHSLFRCVLPGAQGVMLPTLEIRGIMPWHARPN